MPREGSPWSLETETIFLQLMAENLQEHSKEGWTVAFYQRVDGILKQPQYNIICSDHWPYKMKQADMLRQYKVWAELTRAPGFRGRRDGSIIATRAVWADFLKKNTLRGARRFRKEPLQNKELCSRVFQKVLNDLGEAHRHREVLDDEDKKDNINHVQDSHVQESHVQEGHFQEDRLQQDQFQENHLQENLLQENHLQENHLQEQHLQEDHVQENPVQDNHVQEDDIHENRKCGNDGRDNHERIQNNEDHDHDDIGSRHSLPTPLTSGSRHKFTALSELPATYVNTATATLKRVFRNNNLLFKCLDEVLKDDRLAEMVVALDDDEVNQFMVEHIARAAL